MVGIVQPINYMSDVKQPFEQSVSGFESGIAMKKQLDDQQLKDLAVKQALQQQKDMGVLAADPNPTAEKYAALMTKYPSISEHYKRGWDVHNASQQQAKLSQATQVYAALHSNQPQVAVDLLTEQAEALRNSGNEKDAKSAEMMAKFIQTSPDSAKTSIAMMLSSLAGPEKFAETLGKLQGETRTADLHPAAVRTAEAGADKSEVEAQTAEETRRKTAADADLAEIKSRYGERSEIATLAEKGWQIKNIESQIGDRKEQQRLKELEIGIQRAGNDIQRQRLSAELETLKEKRLDKLQAKMSDVTSARDTLDNMLNTADRVLKHPGLQGAVGSVMGKGWMPTVFQKSADFEALVKNLSSQAFLSQVASMKGMGALSDAEGKKLSEALQSLDTTQSPKQFKQNVQEAQRLVLKGRANLKTKYGVPDNVPDTPEAQPSPEDIRAILKKHGVAEG